MPVQARAGTGAGPYVYTIVVVDVFFVVDTMPVQARAGAGAGPYIKNKKILSELKGIVRIILYKEDELVVGVGEHLFFAVDK